MSDNGNGNFGSFFAGVVLGGLIGAGVALLYAPQSGEETRILIKDKSIEIKPVFKHSRKQQNGRRRVRLLMK
jgi:gas vesicle protein